MRKPIFDVGGKVVDLDEVKFDLLSRDRSKGEYWLIFNDDSEIYLSIPEYTSLLDQIRAWRKAGGDS